MQNRFPLQNNIQDLQGLILFCKCTNFTKSTFCMWYAHDIFNYFLKLIFDKIKTHSLIL